MTLQEVLLDDGRPFCSHYGAVVGLTELGPEVLNLLASSKKKTVIFFLLFNETRFFACDSI